MSLQYGLLGLLTYFDSTGYDLSKAFEHSLNHFWHAQSSQIYRELDRMEQGGWVSSRSIVQNKRPNKRLYSITKEGRDALTRWLAEGRLEFETNHEPLLVRVFFGAEDPEVTLCLLKACREMCLQSIKAHSEPIERNIAAYENAIPQGRDKSPYWRMTLDYGMAHTRATAEWAERCIHLLEKERSQ